MFTGIVTDLGRVASVKPLDQGVSLLFVSHDIGTVRSICSRALWLKNGRPEMWGEAKPVAKEYEKFCWTEQGVVMTQAAAPAEPTEPSEIKPAAARRTRPPRGNRR